jgi:hypothetical protein
MWAPLLPIIFLEFLYWHRAFNSARDVYPLLCGCAFAQPHLRGDGFRKLLRIFKHYECIANVFAQPSNLVLSATQGDSDCGKCLALNNI